MSNLSIRIFSFSLSYLIGSIPFSFLIAKLKGIDLREIGTKNVGAGNVFSSVSRVLGIIALILDYLKGWFSAFLASKMFSTTDLFFPLVSSFFAILGHNFPIFLRFRGGKGLATTIGIFSFFFTVPILICGVSTLVLFLFFRKLFLAILISTILFIILLLIKSFPNYIVSFVIFIVLFVTIRGYDSLEKEFKELLKK